VFFNSIIAAYTGWRDCRNTPETAVTFAKGEAFDPLVMQTVKKEMDQCAVVFPWVAHDVLVLDNELAMHSRQTFTPPRVILAYVAQ
jgi:hypothetical protein